MKQAMGILEKTFWAKGTAKTKGLSGSLLGVFKEGRKAVWLEWSEEQGGEWEECSQRDTISFLLFDI